MHRAIWSAWACLLHRTTIVVSNPAARSMTLAKAEGGPRGRDDDGVELPVTGLPEFRVLIRGVAQQAGVRRKVHDRRVLVNTGEPSSPSRLHLSASWGRPFIQARSGFCRFWRKRVVGDDRYPEKYCEKTFGEPISEILLVCRSTRWSVRQRTAPYTPRLWMPLQIVSVRLPLNGLGRRTSRATSSTRSRSPWPLLRLRIEALPPAVGSPFVAASLVSAFSVHDLEYVTGKPATST